MAEKKKTEIKRIPKKLMGIVVSNRMEKTIVVRVESKYAHPMYGKIIKVHKTYQAHCDDKTVEVGDTVMIEEGKPLSRNKSFYFISKVGKSK